MIPEILEHGWVAVLWQVALHSSVAASLLYAWTRVVGLPSGRARRDLLILVLAVPLLTALVPGRGSWEFRERWAWFDSYRVLGLPLPLGLRMWHLAAALFATTAVVSVGQELLPLVIRRRAAAAPAPLELEALARSHPAFAQATITVLASPSIVLTTDGSPGRPQLSLSQGSLERLERAELAAVLRHEAAHLAPRRWWLSHVLYGFRLVQIYNPVALWAFREFSCEVEIACDREAAGVDGERVLARALLAVYRGTARRDLAARASLRRRIDTLLGRRGYADEHLPPATRGAAAALLAGSLPWIV